VSAGDTPLVEPISRTLASEIVARITLRTCDAVAAP